jgi:hypothetical protein
MQLERGNEFAFALLAKSNRIGRPQCLENPRPKGAIFHYRNRFKPRSHRPPLPTDSAVEPDFRAILRDIGHAEWGYSYGFGNGSHFVHGDWRDLSLHHLKRRGRYYLPKWQYSTPDPRIACPCTVICLSVLHKFLTWYRSDPDDYIRPIILRVKALTEALDAAHEHYMNRE